jgi:hypothetical protein
MIGAVAVAVAVLAEAVALAERAVLAVAVHLLSFFLITVLVATLLIVCSLRVLQEQVEQVEQAEQVGQAVLVEPVVLPDFAVPGMEVTEVTEAQVVAVVMEAAVHRV